MITPEEKESFEGPTTGFDSIEVKRIIFSYVYLKPNMNYRKIIVFFSKKGILFCYFLIHLLGIKRKLIWIWIIEK